MNTVVVSAKITSIDVNTPVVAFEHPEYGYIEREIPFGSLPPGAKQYDVIDLTIEKEWPRTKILRAEIEWLDLPYAILSFEHPNLGRCEREFPQSSLPEGADKGDSFDLAVELDAQGRVCGYNPRRNRLEKYVLKEWEKIPRPLPPDNLDDTEAMVRYEEEMRSYNAIVIPLRAKAEAL